MEPIQLEKAWHALSSKDVLNFFFSSPKGLSSEEAELRLEKYGKNEFEVSKDFRFLKLLFNQIKSPLVLILIIAGFVTLFFKAYTDSLVILIAVTINTVIGILQEGKASQAFSKLKESQKKYATVVRNNEKQVILSKNVVPGDILVLSAGDQVAADARVIDSKGLEINESALTGEWLASSKDNKLIKESTTVADRSNMVFMGTLVTNGWAIAVITATGLVTEVGKIADLIGKEKAPATPFQKNIKTIARLLSYIVLAALVLIFVEGILRGHPVSKMLFTAVAVAVAAIPEGLPVAVSVVLAIGMERILSRGGLVKTLNAAETLGSVDLILTDKTGTLTQAIMQISDIITVGSLQESKTEKAKTKDFLKEKDGEHVRVLQMGILASDAFVENPEDELAEWIVRGRPLEQALILAGIESGNYQHNLKKQQPCLDFLPFESERRFAASLNRLKKNKTRVFVSGAPEYLLELSKFFYKDNRAVKFTKKSKDLVYRALEKQTSFGARVIAVAYKDTKVEELPRDGDDVFKDLVFGGLIALHDPLRPDAALALRKAKRAGVNTVMITGDHKKTAMKVAQEVGITKNIKESEVVTGDDIEKISDKDLKALVDKTTVYARVLPHQKLRIVKAWQSLGRTVAMTGDGINDSPSLRRAEVGIALNSGTEVAKEASEIILLNNSFSVIISAIEEGRRILLNLRKILVYLLSTSFSEIILIGFSLAVGLPLPILPAQILWTNLVEEGFMNFAFAFEPKEKGIMRVSPQSFSGKVLLSKESKEIMAVLVVFTSALLVGLYLFLHSVLGYSIEYTRTIIFGTLSVDSIFFAFSLKNFKKPIWKINLFSNLYLLAAVFISLSFLSIALFVPGIRHLLSLQAPDFLSIFIILITGFLNLIIVELIKHFLIANKKK